VIIGVGFICQMVTGINFQGFSTYLSFLENEFCWSKALLAAPLSLTQVEMAILGPFIGYLFDKLGPRAMVTFGIAIFGLGLVLFGFVHEIWSFLAVFTLMALEVSFSSLLVVSTAINNWFHRSHTLGIGIATTGLGISGVSAIPLIVVTQGAFGWRVAAMLSGVAVWAIGIPAGLMMRDRPEKYGLLPDGDPHRQFHGQASVDTTSEYSQKSTDMTVEEALSTSHFWFISLGVALGMFAI
jgi:sugar phosphate permease